LLSKGTAAVSSEDKGFQQFDWSRGKVCPLGLYTRSQWPNNNALQNTYMGALFVSFDASRCHI
jgi:hypothetical protein